jgi:phosphatidylserine/phosphatidylglycerophosphate/cardiolipin synthase-like enzyme
MSEALDPHVQLVITAPAKYGADLAEYAECRTTLGILTQLFVSAQKRVVVAAPFLQEGAGLSGGSLRETLAATLHRGVDVDVVSTRRGLGTLASFLRQDYSGRLRLFRPEGEDEDRKRLGSHAKFCISDQENAYIGSANLTGPGLNENLEIGVMVRGEVAHQLERFWRHAVEIGLFKLYEPFK